MTFDIIHILEILSFQGTESPLQSFSITPELITLELITLELIRLELITLELIRLELITP